MQFIKTMLPPQTLFVLLTAILSSSNTSTLPDHPSMQNSKIPGSQAYVTKTDGDKRQFDLVTGTPLYLYRGFSDISIGPYYARDDTETSHVSHNSGLHLHWVGRDRKKQVKEIPTEKLDTRITLKGNGDILAEGKPGFTLYSVSDAEMAGEDQTVQPSDGSTAR
jgi:hypothetical protein